MKVVARRSRTCGPRSRRRRSWASCRRWARCTPATSRSSRAARAECDTRRRQPLREPGAVRRPRGPRRVPARRGGATSIAAEAAGVDVVFAPGRRGDLPGRASTRGSTSAASGVLEGALRPGHFRGVATVCLKLFHIVAAAVARTSARRTRSRSRSCAAWCATSTSPLGLRVLPTVRDRRRAGDVVAQRAALRRRSASGALAAPAPRRSRPRDPVARHAQMLAGLEVDYVEVAPFDPPVLAGGRPRRRRPAHRQRPRARPRGAHMSAMARRQAHAAAARRDEARAARRSRWSPPTTRRARGSRRRPVSTCCSSATARRWSCSATSPRSRSRSTRSSSSRAPSCAARAGRSSWPTCRSAPTRCRTRRPSRARSGS